MDDTSNDSSSDLGGGASTTLVKTDPKKFKRPPPPPPSNLTKSTLMASKTLTEKSVPETSTSDTTTAESNDNNNLLGLVKCSVCGKAFGKNSIKFHVPQCQRKQQLIKDRLEAEAEKKNTNYIIEESEGELLIVEWNSSKALKKSVFS